ncbi:putative death-receptor fusion protein-domain-containing protein [Durotheca rogersii]|uniref:putative death-receptor fusion protein-domain-containing protein n=1 Tax=Durotheca rogersii TaxID=419775 RepID=UPI0022210A4D|nr:putative death-receptor fusion protein-domain-containing protein [Durotheca rogersii]KAI5868026.1 putative death-receptor fusion protein-domain-containing protein [Durotheca rogersii]
MHTTTRPFTMEPPTILARIGETNFNPKHAVAWIEEQPEALQLWQLVFQGLLSCAEKPKQSSGNACVKLHGFVEQCSKSTHSSLRNFAFAESTALRLFDFFMEWNEQDSHRSMRLVLDFLAHSISKNPVPEVGDSIKEVVLNIAVSAITQQTSRPSVKSAMAALDFVIQKRLVYVCRVLDVYQQVHGLSSDVEALWDPVISKIFAWMELHPVCPIAGKLLVTVFTSPWYEGSDARHQPDAWHEFIYKGLRMNTEYLEPIKLYVFIPLFKADRVGSLVYLNHLYSLQRLTTKSSESWDPNSMLWLAMLEAGKKAGVVNEPGGGSEHNGDKAATQLRVDVLESVLCHDSHEARSSAVSILIASPSTTKPYTAEALGLLKRHLPSFHEDSNPKFRYDVLGHSRNMIKRIQNTIESLRREDDRVSRQANKTRPTSDVLTHIEEDLKGQLGGFAARQNPATTQLRATLRQHEDFASWYVGFLQGELAPTVSYQRHITALKVMGLIIKSAPVQTDKTPDTFGLRHLLIDSTWFRSVLDLIMDPYDDVREAAGSLAMSLSLENGTARLQKQVYTMGKAPIEVLRSFCHRADELARRTARADHSDGVARSFELLYRWDADGEGRMRIPFGVLSSLETKLSAAERDLATAVLQAPVHGSFASLRYLWGSLSNTKYSEVDLRAMIELQDRTIACCQRIWQAVRHVLCDDSPEGHLPEELEEVDGLDTKDLLSYSFRAIHESSNLMRVIASNAHQDRGPGFLAPSRPNFEAIGRLTFEELSTLRHRGAFTTVSQTFASCCQLVKYFPAQLDESGDTSSLLEEWYEGALSCIHTQVSTTRRSAGIPALIVGILSSNADRPSFPEVIRKLQDIGCRPALASETDGSNLPQVHALNSIKDIFKSSHLSKTAEPYLADCLQLAANSLKSEIWAIRNCGLLLLRSLIDCLFGTSESKTSIEAGWDGRSTKISYSKFRALPALLVNLLEIGWQPTGVLIGSQTAESVFPALDIIRRAGPPEESRDGLYDMIARYLGSHIWHVREIAARTLCSFLLKSGWVGSAAELLKSSGSSANKLHGALLTLKFLLERLAEVMPDQLSDHEVHSVLDLLAELPATSSCISTCADARSVYIEIVCFLARLNGTKVKLGKSPIIDPFGHLPSWALEPSDTSGQIPSTSALLDARLGEAAVLRALQSGRAAGNVLKQTLTTALNSDVNVACSILESMSAAGELESDESRGNLVEAYMHVCFETDAPEPRALALENLAALLDTLLSSGGSRDYIPTDDAVTRLWASLRDKPMNPSLSDAIIRVSGPLLAIVVSRSGGVVGDGLEHWLRSWGAMMSDAGTADQVSTPKQTPVRGAWY